MCYPISGMAYIKEPLLLIGKSIPGSGGRSFHLSLSERSFTSYSRLEISAIRKHKDRLMTDRHLLVGCFKHVRAISVKSVL